MHRISGSVLIHQPARSTEDSEIDPIEDAQQGQKLVREVARREAKPGMNQEIFTLSEGEVVLQWPATMTPESFEDFKDWLRLIERKAGRNVRQPESAPEAE